MAGRTDRERVVTTRDGQRIIILREGDALYTLRRLSCPDAAERIERLEALESVKRAAPSGFNPLVRARAADDQLEIVEAYVDGFSLGHAIDRVNENVGVTVALALAYDVVRGLSRLHAIKRRNGDRAHLIHGHLSLDSIMLSAAGETLVTGLEGSRGDQRRDVESVMTAVQELLASRAGSPQGKALLDRLSQLQFTTAAQLESAIKLYLDRQDPDELHDRRRRFVAAVIEELGGPVSFTEERTPVAGGEDSTVYDPIPTDLLSGTIEAKTPSSGELGVAEPWGVDPWSGADRGSDSDSWKKAEPSWSHKLDHWPSGELDPWQLESALSQPEDPTTLDGEAIDIDVVEDPAESETTDSGVRRSGESQIRKQLLTTASPQNPREKKAHVMVGAYRVVASIGRGGMGEIYLARRIDAGGALVALKVLGLEESGDDTALDMFMDEAAILAQIDHPNVLRVLDFGRAHGRYFLATEYLEGRPLVRVMIEAYARESGLDYATIAAMGADAAYGLHAAHTARGLDGRPLEIVHRDVSPQNIFVTYRGVSKVIDFGVARAAERMSRTAVGLVKGKAAYMSPEQAEGRDVDARSDVFSLGTCLWEMAAGKRLFKRDKDYDTLLAVQLADIDPPSKVRGNVDKEFDKIVMEALERDRDRRTASARQLAIKLVEYAVSKGARERAGRMVDLMSRLFGEAARKESELIRSIEERAATNEEAARLRELSGVTGHGMKGLDPLEDFGKEEAQGSTANVLASVGRLKAEREHRPSLEPLPPLEPELPRLVEGSEASSSSGIALLDRDFESVEPDRGGAFERALTDPVGSGVSFAKRDPALESIAPIPRMSDSGDRVPTTLLGERRKRNRRALVFFGLVLMVGAGAFLLLKPDEKEKPASLVGSRVDVKTTSIAQRPEPKPLPPKERLEAKTSTVTFKAMLDQLRAKEVDVREAAGAFLASDAVGATVILDRDARITQLEAGLAEGFILESKAELKTAVTWVGTVDGAPWVARQLSVNDCATTVRIHSGGLGLRYGGTEIMLPFGGGRLRDVSLTPPAFADRIEVAPLGLSLGREIADGVGPHCKIGWWGKRVVLRRLPLGKYTLEWSSEKAKETATLDVETDRVTGGEWVRTSSTVR